MSDRKNDHISLAAESKIGSNELDQRFSYEPLFAPYPSDEVNPISIFGKEMNYPIWISSMTGGADKANAINHNLAKICKEFKLGMGLGSCRVLLESDARWSDFDLRDTLGNDVPFFANLGIAQLENLIEANRVSDIETLVQKLRCDGICIHINPLQEAIQPGGDRIKNAPIDTIKSFISKTNLRVIIKEVGQGFGPRSLNELLQLPIEAIEFGAFGGTNFSNLEMLRRTDVGAELYLALAKTGHTASQMLQTVNEIVAANPSKIKCKNLIISGGITNSIDGYYLTKNSELPAVFGMGGAFLKNAENYENLRIYTQNQIQTYKLAQSYLQIKK